VTIPGQQIGEDVAITEVAFGDRGYVSITNLGAATVSLIGHYLIQRPSFMALPAVRLQAGETMWVVIDRPPQVPIPAPVAVVLSNGQIGTVSADGGELALFATGVLNDPASMLSYVRWGNGGSETEQVAVEAGHWREGDSVTVPEGSRIIVAPRGATSAAGWTVG
jgi:hypothetical protein